MSSPIGHAVPAAFMLAALGCMTPGDVSASPECVRALRFRQLIHEGVMDFIHGGGQWHDMIYLLEDGVLAWVVWERDDRCEATAPVLHARREPLVDALAARPQDDAEGRIPPHEITIPVQLAARIVVLAEMGERQRKVEQQLGSEAVKAKAVGDKDSVHWREGWRE